MLQEIKNLNDGEKRLVMLAPAMVTILIAGADDDIDDQERETAKRITKYKKLTGNTLMLDYYDKVEDSFEADLTMLLKEYPKKAGLRNREIEEELTGLNQILPKIDREHAIAYYDSLKSIAKNVAEASGGFLGFLSVGPEEKKWLNLEMINDPRTY